MCQCESLPIVLISNGLFPVSPVNPRRAVAVELLDLFLSIQEQSSDAVRSLAAALAASYRNRGYPLQDKISVSVLNVFLVPSILKMLTTFYQQGKFIDQPFRKGLGYALKWYDILRVDIERRTEAAISAKVSGAPQPTPANNPNSDHDNASHPPTSRQPSIPPPAERPPSIDTNYPATTSLPSSTGSSTTVPSSDSNSPPGATAEPQESSRAVPLKEASRLLQQRCPACFGGKKYGRSLAQ